MAMAEQEGDAEDFDLHAFRRLYPSDFLLKFLSDGVRPDGRPLGRARPTSISIGKKFTAFFSFSFLSFLSVLVFVVAVVLLYLFCSWISFCCLCLDQEKLRI
jgi:hypothetical protein